ncbi:MAG: MFS transporter, partial [Cyclobacteriaceae bacterium]
NTTYYEMSKSYRRFSATIALRQAGTAATFWFFSFFCVVGFFFILKFLPETKGQSLEQIQRFWKQRAIA